MNNSDNININTIEAATILGISPRTLRTWAQFGHVPSTLIRTRRGVARRYRRSDVERLAAQGVRPYHRPVQPETVPQVENDHNSMLQWLVEHLPGVVYVPLGASSTLLMGVPTKTRA